MPDGNTPQAFEPNGSFDLDLGFAKARAERFSRNTQHHIQKLQEATQEGITPELHTILLSTYKYLLTIRKYIQDHTQDFRVAVIVMKPNIYSPLLELRSSLKHLRDILVSIQEQLPEYNIWQHNQGIFGMIKVLEARRGINLSKIFASNSISYIVSGDILDSNGLEDRVTHGLIDLINELVGDEN